MHVVASLTLSLAGYASSGPADSYLHIWNPDSGSWQPTYTPVTSVPTQTLPSPTQTAGGGSGTTTGTGAQTTGTGAQTTGTGTGTGGTGNTSGAADSTGTSGATGTGSNGGAPTSTSTSGGNGNGNGGGDGGGKGNGNGNGGGDGSGGGGGNGSGSDTSARTRHTTAIVIGTIFGILGLLLGVALVYWCLKRRRERNAHWFSPIHDHADEEQASPSSPHVPSGIPMAGAASREKPRYSAERLLPGPLLALVAVGIGRTRSTGRTGGERRDMLADEDRSIVWSEGSRRSRVGREGSGGSSSYGSARSARLRGTFAGMVTGSWASFKALGLGGRRGGSGKSRDTSGAEWDEKYGGEMFSDEVALITERLGDEEDPVERPRGGWRMSSRQMPSGSSGPYNDPFADQDVEFDLLHDAGSEMDDDEEGTIGAPAAVATKAPHPALRTALPPTGDFVPMSPLIEQASQKSGELGSSSDNRHSSLGHLETSRSSHEASRSPRPSSIFDANPPSSPVRRTDSWWSKISAGSLLNRSSSANKGGFFEFRDPNPPPRLNPIEESMHSKSPESKSNSRQGSGDTNAPVRRQQSLYAAIGHGKSVSSLQTANSETIERAAGSMTIVQRDATLDSQSTQSPFGDDFGEVAGASGSGSGKDRLKLVRNGPSQISQISRTDSEYTAGTPGTEEPPLVTSPLNNHSAFARQPSNFDHPSAPAGPRQASWSQPGPSSSLISAGPPRVRDTARAYERRISQEAPSSPPPTNTRKHEERVGPRPVVRYGLVPKPSLFVANPDKGNMSTDSLPAR